MEPSTDDRLHTIEEKVNAVWVSVEKTRKYFLIIVWVTVVTLVLPAIALIFALPAFLNSYLIPSLI